MKIEGAETSPKPRSDSVAPKSGEALFDVDSQDTAVALADIEDLFAQTSVDDAELEGENTSTDPVAQLLATWTGTTAELPRQQATAITAEDFAPDIGAEATQLASRAALSNETTQETLAETEIEALPKTPDSVLDSQETIESRTAPQPLASADQDAQLAQQVQVSQPDLPNKDSLILQLTPATEAKSEVQQPHQSIQPPRLAPVPPISRQVVDAVIRTRDELVEITLSPEELGRVRMVLGGHDRAPLLTIWAERPETLDQMRRHAQDLAEEFSSSGMDGTQLDFRDGDAGQNWPQPEWNAPINATATILTEQAELPQQNSTVSLAALSSGWGTRHIDIRI